MRGNVRRFIQPPPLAALRDRDLDPSIPAHHAELVRRGLAGDPELTAQAKKFKPDAFRFDERGPR